MKKNMQSFINVKMRRKLHKSIGRGFTLIEILIVIGIIAILASVVLVAVNPARQFKMARDTQRVSNVNAILNSISQNISEHSGVFTCGTTTMALPTETIVIARDASLPENADLYSCLVPSYISLLPIDPNAPGAHYTSPTDYNTGYTVIQDADGRVTVAALGEITHSISVTR